MLILAGVVVSTISGDGLFGKIGSATEKHNMQVAKDKVDLMLGEYILEKYSGNEYGEDPVYEFFDKKLQIVDIEDILNNTESEIIIVVDGYEFVIEKSTHKIVEGPVKSSANRLRITHAVTVDGTTGKSTITISAKDTRAGLKSIEYPDGTVEQLNGEKETQKTYVVNAEGEYIFKVTSNNGYQEEYKIFVIKSISDYVYTGEVQEFKVPEDGVYKIEMWGASGSILSGTTGKGAYTKGEIYLEKDTILYIYVGQEGGKVQGVTVPGFNGGGFGLTTNASGKLGISGGGASDVRLTGGSWDDFESLKSRIMVAAGGGGHQHGGAAGGIDGIDGGNHATPGASYRGFGAKQTSGGTSGTSVAGGAKAFTGATNIGSFGKGGDGTNYSAGSPHWGGGGGGGYYGGGAARWHAGGGGGSSFISGHTDCDAIAESSTSTSIIHTGQANHYSGKVFMYPEMKTGKELIPGPTGGTETGHSGDGYVRITLLDDIAELNGDSEIILKVGGVYTEEGVNIIYNHKYVNLNEIDILGTVNTFEVGTYYIEYKYKDVTLVRKVEVVDYLDLYNYGYTSTDITGGWLTWKQSNSGVEFIEDHIRMYSTTNAYCSVGVYTTFKMDINSFSKLCLEIDVKSVWSSIYPLNFGITSTTGQTPTWLASVEILRKTGEYTYIVDISGKDWVEHIGIRGIVRNHLIKRIWLE